MYKQVTRVMLRSVLVNSVLCVLKIGAGILGNSGALVADGVHSLSDLSTDFVALFGIKQSNKQADKDHPYGHGRFEYYTSLLIGILISYLAVQIIFSSFTESSTKIPSNYVAIVLIFTITAKFLISSYLINKGKEYKNSILISSGHESLSDVYTSIVVLISFFLSKLADQFPILSYSDRVGSFVVGFFILKTGISIFISNSQDILGSAVTDEEEINEVKNILNSCTDIKSIDELNILKFGPYQKAIIQISVDGNISVLEGHNIAHQVEDLIKEKYPIIRYVTIHVNPYTKNHECTLNNEV